MEITTERTEDTKIFLKNLDQSINAVFTVALMFHKLGYDLIIPAYTKTGNHKERMKHTDNGDLYVRKKGEINNIKEFIRIEVKHSSREFINTWEFPKFMVCAKHSYDNANPKPKAYIILSKSMKYYALVDTNTYSQWFVEEHDDKRYNIMKQNFYMCYLDIVKFGSIEPTST